MPTTCKSQAHREIGYFPTCRRWKPSFLLPSQQQFSQREATTTRPMRSHDVSSNGLFAQNSSPNSSLSSANEEPPVSPLWTHYLMIYQSFLVLNCNFSYSRINTFLLVKLIFLFLRLKINLPQGRGYSIASKVQEDQAFLDRQDITWNIF